MAVKKTGIVVGAVAAAGIAAAAFAGAGGFIPVADKGVREFVQAARLSAGHASGLRWELVGSPDPGNPATVTDAELQQWDSEGIVRCLGQRSDIAALYAAAHIVVLPSYREGLPKSLVEAAACGRAVVTTDMPGCRDAIEPGVTGLLVPVRDAAALATAVQSLAADAGLRQRPRHQRPADARADYRHVARRVALQRRKRRGQSIPQGPEGSR